MVDDDDSDEEDAAYAVVGEADDRDAFVDVVPAAFAVAVGRRDAEPGRLARHSFDALKHRAVILVANGFTYRGVFVGADDDDVYLRGELRWFVLPLATVSSIVRDPAVPVDDDDDAEEDGDDDNDDAEDGTA